MISVQSEKHQKTHGEPQVGVERLPEGLANAEDHAHKQVLEIGNVIDSSVFIAFFVILVHRLIRLVKILLLNEKEHEDLSGSLDYHRAEH